MRKHEALLMYISRAITTIFTFNVPNIFGIYYRALTGSPTYSTIMYAWSR